MALRTTTTTLEVDAAGLARLREPRDDLVAERPDGPDRWACAEGPFDRYERTITVEEQAPDRFVVTESTAWELAIPLWGGLFRPLARRVIGRHEPPEPLPDDEERSAPWWSPPVRLDARSTQVLSRLCGLSLLVGYLGTVLTQTITYAAEQFGADKAQQGDTLAAVRVGVLFSVVLMALADRRGRQRLLVLCSVGGTLACAATAAAPGLMWLGGAQTISRAFSTALGLLIAVVAAEEMPAGGRAYAASVLAMTAALGAGAAAFFLPLADQAPSAWRILYLLPMLALPFFVAVGRALPESRRFTRPHGKATLEGHRGRLLMLCSTAFLGLMFFAPNTQFQNDFLRDEHGFSAVQITLFTFSTNTPGGLGIIIGGKLADVRGRRVVGAIGTVLGSILLAASFSLGMPWLWITSMFGTMAAAMTVPALAVYGPELFPTALRARANGILSVAGVAGSAVGLAATGRFADHFGRMGPGLAILALGPLLVALIVLAAYPETAHVELEELNPEDALAAPAVGLGPLG